MFLGDLKINTRIFKLLNIIDVLSYSVCLFDVSAVRQVASLRALELSMLKDWMFQKIKDSVAFFLLNK